MARKRWIGEQSVVPALMRLMDQYAQEVITEEQVRRVIQPIDEMLRMGSFDYPGRCKRRTDRQDGNARPRLLHFTQARQRGGEGPQDEGA